MSSGTTFTGPLKIRKSDGTRVTIADADGNIDAQITTVDITATTLAVTGAASTGTLLHKDLTEVVAATNVIGAAESGSVFFLNSATEFVSTLPAVAAGLHYTFIVSAAPSGASYTVVTATSANIIVGQQHDTGGAAGDFGDTDDTITFVDGQAVAGDMVEVYSDGTNWFAYAFSKVAAGITFSTAS